MPPKKKKRGIGDGEKRRGKARDEAIFVAGRDCFVAAKMLLQDVVPISAGTSLVVILGILATAVLASWFAPATLVRIAGV